MDKLLSRAIRAKSQAARRSKKKYEMVVTRHLNNTRKENAAYLKMVGDDRRTVRAEEKEDHRLGPLAPRRAVGKEELEAYGSFDQSRIIPPSVPRQFRIKHWNICEKERVVVLRGPDRHKIGAVKSIDKKNNTVIVEGLNMVCARPTGRERAPPGRADACVVCVRIDAHEDPTGVYESR